MTTKEIGDRGEELASAYLAENGYSVLERNYRYLKAEVDIICENKDFLVFVEVKTRASSRLLEPEESVKLKKQQLLTSAAHNYIETNDLDKEARFDIVSIIYSEADHQIKHIEEAFYSLG